MINKGEWQWSKSKAFCYRCGKFGTEQCWNREKCYRLVGKSKGSE